jgi:hypothetical protein
MYGVLPGLLNRLILSKTERASLIPERIINMREFAKLNIIFLTTCFLITAFCPACPAATLKENGMLVKAVAAEGKITQALVTVKTANGGPKMNNLQVDYPGSTILSVTASLSVKKGSYKVELLENGRTSFTLRADGRKTVKGSGKMTVNDVGSVQYRVLARQARGVVLDLSFSTPVLPEPARPDRTVSSGRSTDGNEDSVMLALTCLAGKNCRLQVRNMSKTMAYRNILFQVDYDMMELERTVKKSKRGTIEDVLFPGKAGDWPIGLVFGEPPRGIKIKLVTAEAIDPAIIAAPGPDQRKNDVRSLVPVETQPQSDPVANAPAPQPGQIIPAIDQILSMRFFESGYGALPHNQRIYLTEFLAADVRFINWELNLHHPAPGKRLEYDIEAAWRNADGSLITKGINHVFIEPDWDFPSLTYCWGSAFAGKYWKPGAYSVDLYIAGNKIASAGFKVY